MHLLCSTYSTSLSHILCNTMLGTLRCKYIRCYCCFGSVPSQKRGRCVCLNREISRLIFAVIPCLISIFVLKLVCKTDQVPKGLNCVLFSFLNYQCRLFSNCTASTVIAILTALCAESYHKNRLLFLFDYYSSHGLQRFDVPWVYAQRQAVIF